MYDRIGEATDDNISWRIHIACWITKAQTLRIHNTDHFSSAIMVKRTRLSVTYTRTLLVLLLVGFQALPEHRVNKLKCLVVLSCLL